MPPESRHDRTERDLSGGHLIVTQDENREREAGGFYRSLYGEDAPGHVPLWTRQDGFARHVPANDSDAVARVTVRVAKSKDVYFGVGLQPRDLGPRRPAEAAQEAVQLSDAHDLDDEGGQTHEGRPGRHPAVGPRHGASSARRIHPKKEAS